MKEEGSSINKSKKTLNISYELRNKAKQAGLKLPSWLTVRKKVAISSVYTL
jgi:hypothetical protein